MKNFNEFATDYYWRFSDALLAFDGYRRDVGNMGSLEQARADIAAGRVFF